MYAFENLCLFTFNKSKIPSFLPNFHFQKPVLKFAFNDNTTTHTTHMYYSTYPNLLKTVKIRGDHRPKIVAKAINAYRICHKSRVHKEFSQMQNSHTVLNFTSLTLYF